MFKEGTLEIHTLNSNTFFKLLRTCMHEDRYEGMYCLPYQVIYFITKYMT